MPKQDHQNICNTEKIPTKCVRPAFGLCLPEEAKRGQMWPNLQSGRENGPKSHHWKRYSSALGPTRGSVGLTGALMAETKGKERKPSVGCLVAMNCPSCTRICGNPPTRTTPHSGPKRGRKWPQISRTGTQPLWGRHWWGVEALLAERFHLQKVRAAYFAVYCLGFTRMGPKCAKTG